MPRMNVRGDQYLNFTPEEAAAWLGEEEVRRHGDEDAGIGWRAAGFRGAVGAVAMFIVLTMICTMVYATLHGLAHPQVTSETPLSVQSNTATGHGMQRANFPRPRHMSPRREISQAEEREDGYLPAGWSMGCLAQDQPLASGMNGVPIATIPKGTRLLYQIANAADWRLVVAADGSFWGYMCIRPQYGVPERTPMRQEYATAVALIHQLQNGSAMAYRGEGQ